MPPPAGKGYNRPGFKGKRGQHGPPAGKGWRKEGFKGVGPEGTPGQPAARPEHVPNAEEAADDTAGLHPDVGALVARNKRNMGVM